MLVRLSMETGLLQFEIGKAKPGESSLLLALADHEARCSDDACDDDDRLLRVQVLTALGGHYLESSRADDACEAFQRACGLQEMMVVSREDLLGSRRGLAHALELLGETEESEEAYREAIRLAEDLTQEFPGRPLPRHEHALCLAGLARLMNQTGRPAEADRTSLLATQILEEVSQRFPHARNAHFSHAVVLYERSVALGARDAEEAESACCRGINAVEALKVSDGAHRRFQGLLAKLVARRAELEVDGGRLDSARDSLTQAKVNLRVAVEAFPHRADFARLNTRIAELHESLVQASAGSAARE
jgi:tetratricopeptide (TPR) repeat protein